MPLTEKQNLSEKFQTLPWNEKIKLLRVARNWSQQEAAVLLGTTQKNLWLWEKCKSYPRPENRKAIASVFNISEGEIFPSKTR